MYSCWSTCLASHRLLAVWVLHCLTPDGFVIFGILRSSVLRAGGVPWKHFDPFRSCFSSFDRWVWSGSVSAAYSLQLSSGFPDSSTNHPLDFHLLQSHLWEEALFSLCEFQTLFSSFFWGLFPPTLGTFLTPASLWVPDWLPEGTLRRPLGFFLMQLPIATLSCFLDRSLWIFNSLSWPREPGWSRPLDDPPPVPQPGDWEGSQPLEGSSCLFLFSHRSLFFVASWPWP